jgi:hypothetical protein
MPEERRAHTRIKPVPEVTWRSHLGCGALLGVFAGFLGALKEADTAGFLIPILAGVGLAGGLGSVA